jgi:hypothetical protein
MPLAPTKNTDTAKRSSGTGTGKAKAAKGRPVLYKEITINGVAVPPMEVTVELAKELLGWQEEPADKPWPDHFLVDRYGTKVRLANNTTNRPYHEDLSLNYAQQILNKMWRVNGETLVVGRTGLTLSCQHRLIGLVLAEQIRQGATGQAPHWKSLWRGPVSFKGYVLKGVEEDDDTVNTLDTGRGRTLADVLYRSEWFKEHPARDRKVLATMANFAIRRLWLRLNHGEDPFAYRWNLAEAMAFLQRYPRLKEAVEFIHREDSEQSLRRYAQLGQLAALLYLMGASRTSYHEYHDARKAGNRAVGETNLDLGAWDTACDYFVKLSAGRELPGMREALGKMAHEYDGQVPDNSRLALVVLGWQRYVAGKPVRSYDDVRLDGCFAHDPETGCRVWVSTPTVGGPDVGDPKELNTEGKSDVVVVEGDDDDGGDGPAGATAPPPAGSSGPAAPPVAFPARPRTKISFADVNLSGDDDDDDQDGTAHPLDAREARIKEYQSRVGAGGRLFGG